MILSVLMLPLMMFRTELGSLFPSRLINVKRSSKRGLGRETPAAVVYISFMLGRAPLAWPSQRTSIVQGDGSSWPVAPIA